MQVWALDFSLLSFPGLQIFLSSYPLLYSKEPSLKPATLWDRMLWIHTGSGISYDFGNTHFDIFYCLFGGLRQAGPAVVSRWWCPCPWFSPRGSLLSLYVFILPHAGTWALVQELQQGLIVDLVLGGCLTGRSLPRTWQEQYLFLRSQEISTDWVHLQIGADTLVLDILHGLYWQAPLKKTMSQGSGLS